jgi:hypothetical protein
MTEGLSFNPSEPQRRRECGAWSAPYAERHAAPPSPRGPDCGEGPHITPHAAGFDRAIIDWAATIAFASWSARSLHKESII